MGGHKGGRKSKLFICVGGKKYTVFKASKEFGVNYFTLRKRLLKGLEGDHAVLGYRPKRGNVEAGIRAYKLVMRDFYTKSHRLECYNRLIKDMKEQRMTIAA